MLPPCLFLFAILYFVFIFYGCAETDAAVCRHYPACWAPTFPTNGAATTSEPSAIASGSAARRRGAGPNTTSAPCRGSYSELWQGHLKTSLSPSSSFAQPVTGHPAWAQIA